MICGSIGLKTPFKPPPLRAPLRGLGYPKMKMKVIFEFPIIENPRINITHDMWWYPPPGPPAPPPGALKGV